jgi:toxin CptA
VWSPRAATTVIGMTFLAMFLLAGAWAYTDVLAELARGMAGSVGARSMLALALLAGAILGGWTAGRLRSTRVSPVTAVRCFAGGVLMGWGSLLVPGGNDGLLLVGLPLLWPYAWLAFATMCISIAVAMLAARTLQRDDARKDAPHRAETH